MPNDVSVYFSDERKGEHARFTQTVYDEMLGRVVTELAEEGGERVYPGMAKVASIRTAPGLFGATVLRKFPHLAIEDEGRLINERIRDHFLKKLFTLASYREEVLGGDINHLIRFHSRNKMLLMSYNQKELRLMGGIVSNKTKKPFSALSMSTDIIGALRSRRSPGHQPTSMWHCTFSGIHLIPLLALRTLTSSTRSIDTEMVPSQLRSYPTCSNPRQYDSTRPTCSIKPTWIHIPQISQRPAILANRETSSSE